MDASISCPFCHRPFELSAAVQEQIQAEARRQSSAEQERLRADWERQKQEELQEKERQLESARQQANDAMMKEVELLRREREVDEKANQQKLELERKLAEETARIRESAKKEADERASRELDAKLQLKDEELLRAQKKAAEATAKEAELLRRERELGEKASQQALELETRLAEERERIRLAARQEADARVDRELAERLRLKDEELQRAQEKAAEATAKEAQLLRRERELSEKSSTQALELEKKLTEEAARIRERVEKEAAQRIDLELQKQQMREQEREEKMRQLVKKLEEAQQRAQQGSMQVQGEAQEVALANLLHDAFRDDEIADVPKGVSGADLVERVRDTHGRECGTIVWESKRTQSWSDAWLVKLRGDMREAGGSVAVLVTQALPKGVSGFGEADGIWICAWAYAVPVATVLRAWLADVASARLASANAEEKSSRLYEYFTGQEFRNRLEGIVQPYVELRQDLDQEKRSFFSIWKKREKMLDQALKNLTAVNGEFRAIIGGSYEEPEALRLPGWLEREESEEHDGALAPTEADPELMTAFVELLPADGSQVGNASHRTRLIQALNRDVSVPEYEVIKAVLLAAGKIRKGKGKGGAVARAVEDAASGKDDGVW